MTNVLEKFLDNKRHSLYAALATNNADIERCQNALDAAERRKAENLSLLAEVETYLEIEPEDDDGQ